MICYSFASSWEMDFIKRDGIHNSGGTVLFISKDDAVVFAKQVCRVRIPAEVKRARISGGIDQLSIIDEWATAYIMQVDMIMIKSAEFLKADDILPDVYFTKEVIGPQCIRKIEKIKI